MKEKIIAKRYAEAFVDYSRDTLEIKKAISELKELKRLLLDEPEFNDFLVNPEIVYSEKCSFLEKVMGGRFCAEVVDLLKLLVAKRRAGLLTDIVDYIRLNYSHMESIDAVVKSAYPLDLEVVKEIKDKLEKKFLRKMNLFLELDGGLLGGVQVTIGNTVIDGTVRKRIDDLREKLKLLKGGFFKKG